MEISIMRRAWARIVRRRFFDGLFLIISQMAVPLAYSQGTPAAPLALKPVDLKLLVLAGSGTERSLPNKSFLNDIGIPHDDVILAPAGKAAVPLPPLNDQTKGFYQGIILATGALVACDAQGVCASATLRCGLDGSGYVCGDLWSSNVKLLYVPNARYGLSLVSTLVTSALTPGTLTISPSASAIFPYLNVAHPVTVTNSYAYLASPVSANGEATTPILSMAGATVGVVHKKPDGREYLALTLDNNENLIHSLVLSYGLINWVTKGVFVGARQVYLTPQVDDIFLANELFDMVTPGCNPGGFLVDPAKDLSTQCQTDQISGSDLTGLVAWQNRIQANAQTKGFQVTMAFNGVGASDPDTIADFTDPLVKGSIANAQKFIWVNHTYNHLNLDCYDASANGGACRPATAADSALEIESNVQFAKALGLTVDAASMVTPEISGLANPDFVHTAAQHGIKYLIIDNSTLIANPPPSNTGIRNSIENSILLIPRRPTSIFYNVESPDAGDAGSLPDEYNFFYGPQGIFKLAGGAPYFAAKQRYAQILDHEATRS